MPSPRRQTAPLIALLTAIAVTVVAGQGSPLPNKPGSLKFAAIGDNGTGDTPQYRRRAADGRRRTPPLPFDLVIMLGDNMYGGQSPQDFVKKFEKPYARTARGRREVPGLARQSRSAGERVLQAYNMGGQRYYTYARNNVRFFALDSTQMDPKQLEWLEGALRDAKEDWKIPYFHHPLYSDAARHGSSVDLRVLLEPLFTKYGVNVVFSGHDHVYERIKPQKGIYYFVSGSAGQLRKGNMRPDDETAAYFDQDQSFMLVEVAGDDMFFQVISRTGKTVDSGVIHRQAKG